MYTVALCTSYTLTCSVQWMKLLKGYGWGFIELDKVLTIL